MALVMPAFCFALLSEPPQEW
ncbi:MAG: hypothetical protein JWR60_82, partial [Polaromonas sp.]|nr:hypothetical protein [Polaromonas sp.]